MTALLTTIHPPFTKLLPPHKNHSLPPSPLTDLHRLVERSEATSASPSACQGASSHTIPTTSMAAIEVLVGLFRNESGTGRRSLWNMKYARRVRFCMTIKSYACKPVFLPSKKAFRIRFAQCAPPLTLLTARIKNSRKPTPLATTPSSMPATPPPSDSSTLLK